MGRRLIAVGGGHAGFLMKGTKEHLRRRVAKLAELELRSAQELLGVSTETE